MDNSWKGKLKMKKYLVFLYLFIAAVCFCLPSNKEWQCIRIEQKSMEVVENEQVELKKLEQDIRNAYKNETITIKELYSVKADLKSKNYSENIYEELRYINIKKSGFFIIDRRFTLPKHTFVVSIKFKVE